MTELLFTVDNVIIVQSFIDETRRRISDGVQITFTKKSVLELEDLMLEFDISTADIESAIMDLDTFNYYRGIDLSGKADFNVCAFCATVGISSIEIYLKYGLESSGSQILLFSNHLPNYSMNKPFKKI